MSEFRDYSFDDGFGAIRLRRCPECGDSGLCWCGYDEREEERAEEAALAAMPINDKVSDAPDSAAPIGSAWRQVSKDEFFTAIGPQNVTPSISSSSRWPYSSDYIDYITPMREVRGKSVGYLPEGSALEAKRYYLPNAAGQTPAARTGE